MREIFQIVHGKDFYAHDMEVLVSRKASVREEYVDGKTCVTLKFPILADDGTYIGLGGIETDITERKQMEESLREIHQELEQRVRERTMELSHEITVRSGLKSRPM